MALPWQSGPHVSLQNVNAANCVMELGQTLPYEADQFLSNKLGAPLPRQPKWLCVGLKRTFQKNPKWENQQ